MIGTLIFGTARAEEKKPNREREAMHKLQLQLQQANQAHAELQEKLTLSETELKNLRQDFGKTQSRAASETSKSKLLQGELATSAQELQNLRAQKADLEQRLAVTSARLADTEKAMLQLQGQRKLLEASLQATNRQVNACLQSNQDLYAAGRGVIEECRDKSKTATLLRLEPFSGTGHVFMENRLEESRDKLDAGRILPLESSP
jgi:chromosome segregation ATPase